MNYALQSTSEHVYWYTAWWENEAKWTGSARRGNVAAVYWNEVARFTQTAFVIATDIRGGFGINGGHCKPAKSIPRNAYEIKVMADLWFLWQTIWGVTLYGAASGCRRFETISAVLCKASGTSDTTSHPTVTGCGTADSVAVRPQQIHSNLRPDSGSSAGYSDPGTTPRTGSGIPSYWTEKSRCH